jgi:uncharacterized protein
MRKALANAAQRYGLPVYLPNIATLQSNQIRIDTAAVILSDCRALRSCRTASASLGWVATWSLQANGRRFRWSVSGVNYDEAFRNAVRGAARVLSGNGKPL